MTDDNEFNRIVENAQRILKLNAQYENHPYVDEFTKECSAMFVYGTYVLEGEADAKYMRYGIYCRQIIYQTTQATFSGK